MKNQKIVLILLRLSLVSVFLYAAISSFIYPENWIGYFPQILKKNIPANILLPMFSIYEVALSFCILSARKTLYAALLSALTLFGIIAANLGELDVIFGDFAIILASLALAASDL